MAYFLCNFQYFPLFLDGFCHFHRFNGFLCNFLGFPLLWAASAKNAAKVVISRFPSDFEHITNKSRWHIIYFPCKCHFFPLLWSFCQTAEKVAVSILSFIEFLYYFLVLTLLWGAPFGTTAETVAISMLFPLQESLNLIISLP